MAKKKAESSHDDANIWADMWMKQSQLFADITNQQLKNFFEKGHYKHPEKHMDLINDWLDQLKSEWQFAPFNEHLKSYTQYSQMMTDMMTKTTQLLIERWIAISKSNQPVSNIRDLYELWLSCCHDVYSEAMHSKAYQDMYGEWMNNALKFWKSMLPNK